MKMNRVFRVFAIIFSVFVIANIIWGCGGNATTPGGISPKSAITSVFGLRPHGGFGSFHGASGVKTASTTFSIEGFKVHAQTSTTFSAAGSYTGVCNQLPNVLTSVYLNGAGNPFFTDDCASNFSDATAAGICSTVIGDGTLQHLTITNPTGGAFTNSGHVTVQVFQHQANGSFNLVTTPINATLGTNIRVDDGTDTFAVHDQDSVCLRLDVIPGDTLHNITAIVFKTVP